MLESIVLHHFWLKEHEVKQKDTESYLPILLFEQSILKLSTALIQDHFYMFYEGLSHKEDNLMSLDLIMELTFVSGEKEIQAAINNWNQDKIHNFLTQQRIKWRFNPPMGSHGGGA